MRNDGSMECERVVDLFSRDGHLTMLGLDRFSEGELTVEGCDAVVAHLRDCSVCEHRWAEMRAHDVVILPPPHLRIASARARAVRGIAIGVTLAAAACLLLWAMPQPQQASLRPQPEGVLSASPYTTTAAVDGVAAPSTATDLRLHAGDRTGTRVFAQDSLPWSESVTVEVGGRNGGWVSLVVVTGADDEPLDGADGTGGAAPSPEAVVLLPPAPVRARSAPLRLVHDPEPGRRGAADQRYVLVQCPTAFDLDPGTEALEESLGALPDACTIQELAISRFSDVADS